MAKTSKRIEYVVIRDSSDLGLDKGTHVFVVPGRRYADGRVDVDVPALDMRIAKVSLAHPDLKLIGVR